MAFCTNCGQQVDGGAKFCANCGTPISQNTSNTERKTVFDGEIHKCPKCGWELKSFDTVCPNPQCGIEIRGRKVSSAVQEFSLKLESIVSVEKRIELIKNFYIPNTKEDIYEFFIYAMSNLSTSEREADAWQVKLEQTYHKAKLSFGNTSEFEYIHNLYIKTSKAHRKKVFKKSIRKQWKVILSIVLGIISLTMILVGFFKGSQSGDSDSPYYAMSCIGMILMSAPIFILVDNKKK